MSFDSTALEAALAHGPVVRVLILSVKGSAPRDAGTAMLVWDGGQSGTIGGGALEWDAIQRARSLIASGSPIVETIPLGPSLGQCCGGAVRLLWERFDTAPNLPFARRIEGDAPEPQWNTSALQEKDGWLREEPQPEQPTLWVWGAGHTGRAVARMGQPFFAVRLVDLEPEAFPPPMDGVDFLPTANPTQLVPHCATDAHHVILTRSHDLDLQLCDAVLRRGFASAGLIGSETKWARFRKRLEALGHKSDDISRIVCPIGTTKTGRSPDAIALSVIYTLQTFGRLG